MLGFENVWARRLEVSREPVQPAVSSAAAMRRDSPLLRRRGKTSPAPRTPPYAHAGLDGSGDNATARRFVDYKMEPAPSRDGEHPESTYRKFARNLKLWLIEAEERLPPTLIGKRIVDSTPYGSRMGGTSYSLERR